MWDHIWLARAARVHVGPLTSDPRVPVESRREWRRGDSGPGDTPRDKGARVYSRPCVIREFRTSYSLVYIESVDDLLSAVQTDLGP